MEISLSASGTRAQYFDRKPVISYLKPCCLITRSEMIVDKYAQTLLFTSARLNWSEFCPAL